MELEEAIKKLKRFCEYENNIVLMDNVLFDYQEAIETVLKALEELKDENEELKKNIAHKNYYTQKLEEDLFQNCSNYVVPKDKIKEKINENNKKIYKSAFISTRYENKLKMENVILQELLER